MAKLMVGV